MQQDETRTWVNFDTGEKIDNVTRIITEQQEHKILEFRKHNNAVIRIQDAYGEFFFYKYDDFLSYLNYDLATAFRFLYLCSFANKDGRIVLPGGEYVKEKKDFIILFNCPRKTADDFYHNLLDNDLIYQDFFGAYRVNDNYFSKKIINDEDFRNRSTRVFDEAIQNLYKQLTSNEHTFAGELLKLIPYMNIRTNILCRNIDETIPERISPLSKEELQNIFRPNSDYGRKLRSRIEKFSIHNEPVIGKITLMYESHYFVNPRLFYRGDNINDLKAILDHIDISVYQSKHKKG